MASPPTATGLRDPTRPTLARTLGTFDGVALLVGITIGSGIFATPGAIAAHHATFGAIALYWVLGGAYAFVGALIYAELGTRMPNTGGEYVYLSRCYGPHVGFMFGWSQLFMIRTSAAAGLALVTVDYFRRLVGVEQLGTPARVLGSVLVIALLGWVNYVGVRPAAWYQRFSTVFKVGGLLALVLLGTLLLATADLPSLLWSGAPPTAEDLGLLGAGNAAVALMLIVFSYLGWDRVGYVAGEMKDPRRTIPLSMLVGMSVVMASYLLAIVIYHSVLGMEGVRATTTVAWDTANALVGGTGAAAVAVVVIVSATGSINGTMMTAPRAYYAMARDGLFLRWLDFVHPRFRTPSRAVLAHCVWASVIVAVRVEFAEIVSGMVFALLIFYALTTGALFMMRRHGVGVEGAYRMPLYPVLPAVYLVGIVVLLLLRAWADWRNTMIDLAFIGVGIPFALYFCRGMRREDLAPPVEVEAGTPG